MAQKLGDVQLNISRIFPESFRGSANFQCLRGVCPHRSSTYSGYAPHSATSYPYPASSMAKDGRDFVLFMGRFPVRYDTSIKMRHYAAGVYRQEVALCETMPLRSKEAPSAFIRRRWSAPTPSSTRSASARSATSRTPGTWRSPTSRATSGTSCGRHRTSIRNTGTSCSRTATR